MWVFLILHTNHFWCKFVYKFDGDFFAFRSLLLLLFTKCNGIINLWWKCFVQVIEKLHLTLESVRYRCVFLLFKSALFYHNNFNIFRWCRNGRFVKSLDFSMDSTVNIFQRVRFFEHSSRPYLKKKTKQQLCFGKICYFYEIIYNERRK